MNFRTSVLPQSFSPSIGHSSKIISLGSCFAIEMYNKLAALKFDILANPHGILFNPLSIANSLEHLLVAKVFQKEELHSKNGLWFSWDHHGSFSGQDPTEVLHNINDAIVKGQNYLQTADWIMITFGTAFTYKLIDSQKVVGNCHKQPQSQFKKSLVNPDTIYNIYLNIIRQLKKFNPNLNVLLSVSPVRHIGDGLVENNRSKAILNNAVHQLVDEISFVHYFPSYEILMDDLRDYRFYKRDLIHPSDVSIDYIWDKFQSSFFTKKTIELNSKLTAINMSLSHRALYPESEEHRKFIQALRQKMVKIQEYEGIDFTQSINNLDTSL